MNEYGYHLVEEVRSGRLTRRDLVRRASIAGLSASAIGTLLSACGGSSGKSTSTGTTTTAAGPPKRGGKVTVAQSGLASSVDPVTSYNAGGTAIITPATDKLALLMPDYTLRPALATKWQATAAKEWRFSLRPNVRFQDGSLMTADDVVATFERLVSPKSQSAALSTYKGILSAGNIEKVDDSTVAFHLDRPYADFPYLVSYSANSVILPRNYKIGDFVKGNVGTGPFILTNYSTRQGATYRRNPHYWDKPKPYLDSWEVRFYSDYSPMVLALQTGDVDIVPAPPYQTARPLLSHPDLKVLEQKGSAYREVHMRVDQAPWTDKRVRQALAYTLDRRAIVQGLFGGRAVVANDYAFAAYMPGAPTGGEIPQREQDIEKAKALLSQAGHSGPLNVTLTTENYLEIPQYVTLLKSEAAKAGININLHVEDLNTYYGSGNNQPWLDVNFGCVDWASRPIAGQLVDSAFRCGGPWNSAHWCDKGYDKAVARYEGETDEQRRRTYAVQAAKIQQDATPAVIAYWVTALDAMKKTVQGYNAVITDSSADSGSVWLST